MSEPFLAEIRMVGFTFAPRGWAFCDGQILPINQNQALYSLLGTTYGGDGRVSFALPDLKGRVPIHVGNSGSGQTYNEGQKGGSETHTLNINELPGHSHTIQVADAGNSVSPVNNYMAESPDLPYRDNTGGLKASGNMLRNTGGSQAHENMQPYIVINFCVALQGIFPSPN